MAALKHESSVKAVLAVSSLNSNLVNLAAMLLDPCIPPKDSVPESIEMYIGAWSTCTWPLGRESCGRGSAANFRR